MTWNESAFQARIMARAKELGLSERDVMRKAGVSGDTFDKVPGAQGRTYNTIEAIAEAVGYTVAEALGQALSVPLLEMAVTTAIRAIPSDRLELLSAAILEAYDALVERQRTGPIEARDLSMLEASLRARSRGR